jgi:hypothetical protein
VTSGSVGWADIFVRSLREVFEVSPQGPGQREPFSTAAAGREERSDVEILKDGYQHCGTTS